MTVLARAPLLIILGALAASLALFDRTGSPFALLLTPLLTAGLALCSYEQEIQRQWEVLIAALLLSILCALRVFFVLSQPQDVSSRPLQTEGTVVLVRPWGRQFAALLETPEGRILLRLPFASLTEGMRLNLEGVVYPLRPASRPGGFDEERYWRSQGVSARLSPSRLEPLPQRWSLSSFRYSLWRALVIHMPPLTGAYLSAIWTGKRAPDLGAAHRVWGTSHLLAVSGFHVALAVFCASSLLGKGHPALSLLMWAYVLLTGAAPSALRAGLMFQGALLGRLLGRPNRGANSVCLAALLLLLHSPFLFWDVGWRLSVLSALTLTLARRRRWWDWPLFSPLVALVTYPQAAHTFGTVPLVGFLLNLLAPIFFSVAFIAASGVAALYFLGLPVSWLLRAVEEGFLLWEGLADWGAAFLPLSIPWMSFFAWLGAGTLFFLLSRYLELQAPRSAALVLALTLAAFWLFL